MNELRLLIDPPAAGAWNMAVDEALLETAANTGQATLRFYQWQESTLSLGYFQVAADREQHSASLSCPLVRRASGGGAILHDRELTYSLAIAQASGSASAARELYEAFHQTLIETLATFSVKAAMHREVTTCDANMPSAQNGEPFLCFQRRACFDVVCQEAKIVGSAQRRRRGAVLQHGSILLARSPFAPELPGIADLANRSIDPLELTQRWLPPLTSRLNVAAIVGELTPPEITQAQSLAASRFSAADYVGRR
jgi:lipoate-protein ligase A